MASFATAAALSLPLIGAYAIYAIGIVLIYRASKVLNLAHGAMAAVPAFVLFTLRDIGIPLALAVPLAIACGGLMGWLVERLFVRPMRAHSTSAQTVGTVVVLGFALAAVTAVYGTAPRARVGVFPERYISVSRSSIQYGEIGLFVTMLLLFAGLTLVFRYTDLGLLLRGAAENRTAAALMGVNPERMTALTWVIGGSLAATAGILLAAVTSLEPYTLTLQALPGFLAALVGGLGSITGAVWGSALVALVISTIPVVPVLQNTQGTGPLLLAILGTLVMASRGKRIVGVGAVE